VSNSLPDDPRSIANEQPCANDPSGLVRVIVGDGVVNIIDNRPSITEPLPPHMIEQLRRARRRREGLPDDKLPPAAD
jgi:hypothetical protein